MKMDTPNHDTIRIRDKRYVAVNAPIFLQQNPLETIVSSIYSNFEIGNQIVPFSKTEMSLRKMAFFR